MTINQRYLFLLCLLLNTLWWGWTLLIDVVIVPTVFANIPNFFLAGELGIELFSKFNKLEIILSSCLVALLGLQCKRSKSLLPYFVASIACWLLVMFYFSYLTPKIIDLTSLWKSADSKGLISIAGIPDIQQEHQYFHKIYIVCDSVKLLILSFMLTYAIIKEDKWV